MCFRMVLVEVSFSVLFSHVNSNEMLRYTSSPVNLYCSIIRVKRINGSTAWKGKPAIGSNCHGNTNGQWMGLVVMNWGFQVCVLLLRRVDTYRPLEIDVPCKWLLALAMPGCDEWDTRHVVLVELFFKVKDSHYVYFEGYILRLTPVICLE